MIDFRCVLTVCGEIPSRWAACESSEPSPITESVPRRNLPHSRQIPWGYGRDRLTAIAVDPDRMFLYWEVRDETLDAGRQRLGPAGARAALVLRIYDTSGRIFDGDNAHSYFDQDIQRSDRQWFCSVGMQ